ncbi:MAG: DEAD/DEAH box helicase [Spirochaetia bacterium]|nr:DEAD/DEAH box helicase [Spirochaetia bacterium]
MESNGFAALGLDAGILAALEKKGFEEPTPIQAMAVPRLLSPGAHIVARARTGTGKTAAFGLPLIQLLRDAPVDNKPRALVLVPTRELALQVCGEISTYRGVGRPVIAPVYGGASYGEQIRRLERGVDIVVGTPGRVIDHMDRGTLDLSALTHLVLDEADEMLDMGFVEDIEKVLEKSNPERRVLLFSATMPREILRIASRHLGQYETIEDQSGPLETTLTDQIWLEVHERDKLEALRRVIDVEEDFYGIVFCSTKVDADDLARDLAERGYEAEALHGDLSQSERERVLGRFRTKRTRILSATDVAARGIDVEKLTHVVNFSLPHDPESYTHRIGRTGRAGNAGTALTFVTPEEYRRLFFIQRSAGKALRKGSVPAVDDVLDAKRERIRTRIMALAGIAVDEEPAEEAVADAVAAPGTNAHEGGAEAAAPSAEAGGVSPEVDAPSGRADGVAAPEAEARSIDARWLSLADDMLGKLSPREAVAAALAAGFEGELDETRYAELRNVSVDATAKTRLFIGIGKRDNVQRKDVADLVKKLAGIPDRLVDSVEVYEAFSFATVPFEAAERAIAEARRQGGMPPVRPATPRGGDSRPGYGPRRPGFRPGGPRQGGYQGRSNGPRPDGDRRYPGPRRDGADARRP